MRIEIIALTTRGQAAPVPSSFIIAKENGFKENPSNLDQQTTSNIEIIERLRAKGIQTADRLNEQNTFSFTVAREHQSVGDAENYVLNHRSIVPRRGDVKFTTEKGTLFYLRGAAILTSRNRHEGATSFHTYNITGGIIEDK